MEKYNKRVPGRISGVLLILLGSLGVAYNILLLWMDIQLMKEFQNEELPELARTQIVFTVRDVFLAILCLILLVWGVHKIVCVIRFYRLKKFIGDRELVALEELAEKFHTSKTKNTKNICRCLRRWIRKRKNGKSWGLMKKSERS